MKNIQQRTTGQLLSDQADCEMSLETCLPNDAQELSALLSEIETELKQRKLIQPIDTTRDDITIDELTPDLNTLYSWAINEDHGGRTRYAGMTYEDGIKATVDWLQGNQARPDLEA